MHVNLPVDVGHEANAGFDAFTNVMSRGAALAETHPTTRTGLQVMIHDGPPLRSHANGAASVGGRPEVHGHIRDKRRR